MKKGISIHKKKLSAGEIIFQTINCLFSGLFALICIYPFFYIFLYSISDPKEASKGNILFLPVKFTLNNYQEMLGSEGIINAFFISISRTVLGTVITLVATGLFAYILIKKELPFRKLFYRATIVSMYLSAGLIPWYVTMWKLGLKDNYMLYILPFTINAYFLVLIKTYMESLPASLEESAFIDGAGLLTVFFKIIFPVCKPIFAAVAVFSAVFQWNQWYDNFMLVDTASLATLQYKLMTILLSAENVAIKMMMSKTYQVNIAEVTQITPTSIRMTTTMIVAIPIILVYPSLQRYFVKGIMMGAIKG